MKPMSIRRIDRSSPMPVYQQIVNDIIARIYQEEWIAGQKLPSEKELSDEYGASRVTIRQALAKLETDGIIDKQRGRGTYLKDNPRLVVQELYLPQAGVRHHSDNTPIDTKISVLYTASADVYSFLNLEMDTKLIYLERTFLRKGKIVGINRAWFPFSRFPDMAEKPLVNNSISETLQNRYGVHFQSVDNYIESVILSATAASQLNTVSPCPALKISSIFRLDDDTPVEYSVTTWYGRDTLFRVVISSD